MTSFYAIPLSAWDGALLFPEKRDIFVRAEAMHVHYSIDTDRGIIFTEAAGSPLYADLALFLQRLLRDSAFSPAFDSVLTLWPGFDLQRFSRYSGRMCRTLFARYAALRTGASWAVVSNDLDAMYGFARFLLSVPCGTVRIGFFTERSQAVSWIDALRREGRLDGAPVPAKMPDRNSYPPSCRDSSQFSASSALRNTST